ncbi:Slc24a1 [Symbiodinium natans]|uniref:Slc24a1 protein n=1 Tax=Symbiodinium natans TaxID=878477 RepID=A0A812GG70_9DINO|nr:Slc24a1 [Symbiodinium natans]
MSVWIPKILEPYEGGTDGDGLPPAFDLLTRRAEIAPDRFKGPWHPSKTLPKVLKVVDAMRKAGIKRYGVLGVCYGAWVGFHLARSVPSWELICGASPHPSLHMEAVVGGDPVALAREIRCPWAFFPCGEAGKEGADPPMYDADGDVFRELEARFPGKNKTKRYKSVRHGFFARGAIKDGNFKAGDGEQVKRAVAECVADVSSFYRKRGLLKADARSYLRMFCCWCCCLQGVNHGIHNAESVTFPAHLLDLIVGLRAYLRDEAEPPVRLSDRRMGKAVRLIRLAALAAGSTEVSELDLLLLQHMCWDKEPSQAGEVRVWLLERMRNAHNEDSEKDVVDQASLRSFQLKEASAPDNEFLDELKQLGQASVLCMRELFRTVVNDGDISEDKRILLQNAGVLLSQVDGKTWVSFPDNQGQLKELTPQQLSKLRPFFNDVAEELRELHDFMRTAFGEQELKKQEVQMLCDDQGSRFSVVGSTKCLGIYRV